MTVGEANVPVFSNRRQWLTLVLIVVGFAAYRILFVDTPPTGEQVVVRSNEIDLIWHRLDPYPGTSLDEAQVEKQVTDTGVVSVHRWQTEAAWPAVRTHFEQTLPEAAWYRLGETTSDAGAPMLLFRQPPFHMMITLQNGLLELRATWSADGAPLVP